MTTGKPDSRNKWILMVLAALVIGILADLLLWYTGPGSLAYTQTGETVILTQENIDHGKAKIEDGRYIPKGGRVILNFVTGRLFGRDVVIRLWEPQEQKTPVRLSYAKAGMDFNNDRSIVLRPEKDQSEIRFTLPEGDWNRFKLAYTGTLSLQEIVVGKEAAVQSRAPWQPNWIRMLAAAAVVCALALILQLSTVRKALRTVYRRCLDPETRFKAIDWVYFVFALAMVFHHVYAIVWQSRTSQTADLFQVPFLIFAAVSILLGRMWKDKGFWCLLAFYLLMYFRMAVPEADALHDARNAFIFGVYAFFGCYPAGRALRPALRKPFLQTFCALWTLGLTVLCACGIYVIRTGSSLTLPGGSVIGVYQWGRRLWLAGHPVTSGIMISVSLGVVLIGFLLQTKILARTLYVIAAAVLVLAETLTATRTAYVVAAAVFSLLLCTLLYDRLNPVKKRNGYGLPVWKWGVLLAAFLLFTAVLSLAQPFVVDGFNAVSAKGGLVVSRAAAEEAGAGIQGIDHRDFMLDGKLDTTMTTRADTWKALFQVIRNEPGILLWGKSVNSTMTEINALRQAWGTYSVAHCHNVFLQILYDSGLPGFLLYLGFMIRGALCFFRLLKNKGIPFWQRMIPLPAAACLLGDLVDITGHFRTGNPQMTLLFLFTGLAAALTTQHDKKPIP